MSFKNIPSNISCEDVSARSVFIQTLKEIGLTEQEIRIYAFLVKRGPSKASEISRANGQTKLQIYRNLKNLQKKNIIECIFGHPAYFSAVPLNKMLKGFIKTKEEEVVETKVACKILLEQFRTTDLPTVVRPDMFAIIEDRTRIYSKAKQMLEESKQKVKCTEIIANQFDADQTTEAYRSNAMKRVFNKKIDFKEIFYISNWNYASAVRPIKYIFSKQNVELRHIELQVLAPLSFPRICIRDDEEILVFISPKIKGKTRGKDEKALWTNNQSIVYVYVNFWNSLWEKAKPLREDFFKEKLLQKS